jgi:hypothetical protein
MSAIDWAMLIAALMIAVILLVLTSGRSRRKPSDQ